MNFKTTSEKIEMFDFSLPLFEEKNIIEIPEIKKISNKCLDLERYILSLFDEINDIKDISDNIDRNNLLKEFSDRIVFAKEVQKEASFDLHTSLFKDNENTFKKDTELIDNLLIPESNYYNLGKHRIVDCLYKITGFRNDEEKMIYIGSTNYPIRRMLEHFDIYKNQGKIIRDKSRQFHSMEQMTNCDSFNIEFYKLKTIANPDIKTTDNLQQKLFFDNCDDIYLNYYENLLTLIEIFDNSNQDKDIIISGGCLASIGKNILV